MENEPEEESLSSTIPAAKGTATATQDDEPGASLFAGSKNSDSFSPPTQTSDQPTPAGIVPNGSADDDANKNSDTTELAADTKPVLESDGAAAASVAALAPEPVSVPEPAAPISTPAPDNKFDPPVEMLVDDEEEPPEAPKEATMSPFCARSLSASPAASPVLIQGNESSQSSSGSEEILPDQSTPMDKVDVGRSFNQDEKPEPSTLRHIHPDPLELDEPTQAERRVTTRLRRTVVRQPTNSEDDFFSDEDEDDEEEEEEEEMRKTIMIGGSYQAVVPEGLCKYGDAKPYKNADKLLWDPKDMSDDDIEKFLVSIKEFAENAAQGIDMLPMGAHTRDDEQALYLLMQSNYNVEEALKKWTSNPSAPSNTSQVWTDEECRNFENGLLMYGKDFHTIQAQKVRTRSVAELVQFYYLWKKTERHDIFANKMRPDKKKYMLHPGITLLVFEMLEKENNKEATPKDSVTA